MKSYQSFDTMESLNRERSSSRSLEELRSSSLSHHRRKGLNVLSASIFIVGEMAGSGVLALPKAIVNAGWIGLVLLVAFCVNAAYSGMKLGACWEIIEERYPEHRETTRNPYAVIAYRAVGRWGRAVVSVCIKITLFGAGTVYLLLASQIVQELLQDYLFTANSCVYFVGISIFITPLMWFGTPKEFSVVGILALLSTVIACVLFFVQIILDATERSPGKHKVHNFEDFFLAFGTLLFAFGGASTFPTIQNDMKRKGDFSTSVVIAFVVTLALYFPVTLTAYLVYGEDVQANFAMSLSRSAVLDVANTLMAVHLVFAFLIVINPVCQEVEESFNIPRDFNFKRCLVRSGIVLSMIVIGETVPNFSKILALIGGSTITLATFVLPPYFYMKLCGQKSESWETRHIPLFERVYMWEMIVIGIIGGSASTYSALKTIFEHFAVAKPCYWIF